MGNESKMGETLCIEHYGSSSVKRSYTVNIQDGQTNELTLTVKESKSGSGGLASIRHFFRSVFLPQGYPESVSKDYLAYQIWDTVQAFSSSITGALATQAVLQGVGVGDDNATVMAATMTWMLKDGTGMVGRILFSWLQGSYLDCDCKRWRLFADFLNDLSICIEILAPHFKEYFRYIICISGVARSIVGVAGGATRAALTQHQARRHNMADVSAKDGSQETLVNLAALIFTLLLIPMVTGNHPVIWTLFLIFTSLHLFANYRAVKSVSMESFNQTRHHLACQRYLSSDLGSVGGVSEINRLEPVVWKLRRNLTIHLGVPLAHFVDNYSNFKSLQRLYKDDQYMLFLDIKKGRIFVCLHSNSTVTDHLKACYHAEVLEYTSSSKVTRMNSDLQRISNAIQQGDLWSALSYSHAFTHTTFSGFCREARTRGWDLDQVLLSADEWRADWGVLSSPGAPGAKKAY